MGFPGDICGIINGKLRHLADKVGRSWASRQAWAKKKPRGNRGLGRRKGGLLFQDSRKGKVETGVKVNVIVFAPFDYGIPDEEFSFSEAGNVHDLAGVFVSERMNFDFVIHADDLSVKCAKGLSTVYVGSVSRKWTKQDRIALEQDRWQLQVIGIHLASSLLG